MGIIYQRDDDDMGSGRNYDPDPPTLRVAFLSECDPYDDGDLTLAFRDEDEAAKFLHYDDSEAIVYPVLDVVLGRPVRLVTTPEGRALIPIETSFHRIDAIQAGKAKHVQHKAPVPRRRNSPSGYQNDTRDELIATIESYESAIQFNASCTGCGQVLKDSFRAWQAGYLAGAVEAFAKEKESQ